eukprot:IDg18466t1
MGAEFRYKIELCMCFFTAPVPAYLYCTLFIGHLLPLNGILSYMGKLVEDEHSVAAE